MRVDETDVEFTACPDCAAPAEVVERFELASDSGPVDHVKLRCVRRHWFLMPTAVLRAAVASAAR